MSEKTASDVLTAEKYLCHSCGKWIVFPEHGEVPVFARVLPLRRVSDGFPFPNACSPACFQKLLDDPLRP